MRPPPSQNLDISFAAMVSTKTCTASVLALTLVACVDASLHRRDGSTITVQTTQFNPAIQNQGGTTNAAGTFNVSPLATSTSYQFQTLQQTSTFQLGPVNIQAANPANAGSGGTIDSGSGSGSGSGSSANGDVGGGTIVVTATAPTSTVNQISSAAAGTSSTGVATASNGLPSLALGASSSGGMRARAMVNEKGVWSASLAMLVTAMCAAFVVV